MHHPTSLPRGCRKRKWLLCRAFVLAGLLTGSLATAQQSLPKTAQELFQPTKVWNIHLSLTPEAWKEMEPKGGGFGPSMFMAPAFMQQADTNHDGKITVEEFSNMATRWFDKADKAKKGTLDNKQLTDGLNDILAPPEGGAGGGGFSLQGQPGKKNGVAGAMGIDFKYVKADLEFEGQLVKEIGLRYKGNGTFLESRPSLKRSLKMNFSKYTKGQKVAGLTTINLHNNVTDATWMNETIAHRTFREANVPAPRTSYARVYVTVPGKFDRRYLGLYSIVENVDKQFIENAFQTKEGAILKPSSQTVFTYMGEDWAKYERVYEPRDEMSPAEKAHLKGLCKLVSQASDAEFNAKIGNYLEIDQFARFMSVMVWITDFDSLLDMGQNLYVHMHPKTHKLRFIAWDQDHSFGQFGMQGTQDIREQLSIRKPWMGEKRFLERMFKSPAFQKYYMASLRNLTISLLKPEKFNRWVEEYGAGIRPAVEAESKTKLAKLDKAVAGESYSGNSFGPFGGSPPVKPIKPFVKARSASITAQLAGTSKGRELPAFGMFGGTPPPPKSGDKKPPQRFGPGNFTAPMYMNALDTNKDKSLSHEEFVGGFAKWFTKWDKKKQGFLTEDELREGIDSIFNFGGPPGGGPPGDDFGF